MEASVHFVLSVVLILVLTSSITVICWELPMELHSKNDARQRIYYPRTKREYQIKNNIYTNRQTESQIFLRGLKDSRHNYRFGHMLDAAFNGHFQSINNKRLVRQKRDSVFENHTSVFALLGGILFFVFLGGVALFCWWSKSCGVEKGDNGQVPPEYETGARVFIANYNSGYENLAFHQDGRNSPQDPETGDQPDVMETNIDQFINQGR